MAFSFTPSTMQVTTRKNAAYINDCSASSPTSDSKMHVSLGAGQTATRVSGSNGGYYEFDSGTTANAETTILFLRPITSGAKVQIFLDRSIASGVANQQTFIELVEVNASLLFTNPASSVITSGTDAQVNNAANAYQVMWPAALSQPQVWTRRDATASVNVSASISDFTSPSIAASRGSSPNFLPGNGYIFKIGNEGIHAATINMGTTSGILPGATTNNASAQTIANSAVYAPLDVAKTYVLRIRIKNLSTAPASSVITRIYRVSITEDAPLAADVFSSGLTAFNTTYGSSSEIQYNALPVRLMQQGNQGLLTSISSSLVTLSTTTSQTFNSTFNVYNTNTILGAGGIYNTGSINQGSIAGKYVLAVFADVDTATDGVLIECSNSTGIEWFTLAKGSALANTPFTLTTTAHPNASVSTGNWFVRVRARVINGASSQGKFSVLFYAGVI